MDQELFHDESWTEPWRSSEFPPGETALERRRRFRKKPGWSSGWNDWVPRFFQIQATRAGGWPWGYVIYRTTFTETSDQDWAVALEILDRYCHAAINESKRVPEFRLQPNIDGIVAEGYRNVIIQDPSLEGAPTDIIRKRHIQWVEERGFELGLGTPRFDFCIVLDARSIRSILASTEPDQPGMIGYVNVVDCTFEYHPEDPDDECGEYYDGLVRVDLNSIFQFALSSDDITPQESPWGDGGMERPGWVIYTDGHCSAIEKKEVFLVPSDYNLYPISYDRDWPRKKNMTESQYKERLKLAIAGSEPESFTPASGV
ncbi:hypothetical protein PEBR_31877 [Penicillium brasilianum]|uniref:Uncharacterized protein n=1 Tax=Penicillium brasilianum TaxID=104259 RepID=A0A1S9RFR7_PENBI|nr:hypothetical protein PEBR_31877 [Penicillium brasilianum]